MDELASSIAGQMAYVPIGHLGASPADESGGQSSRGSRLFFYYDVDQGDELSEEERGRFRGGKSIYGTLAIIQETFGYGHRQVLWGESWASLMMKISDKPHYDYGEKKPKKLKGKKEILKHLSKYVKSCPDSTSNHP